MHPDEIETLLVEARRRYHLSWKEKDAESYWYLKGLRRAMTEWKHPGMEGLTDSHRNAYMMGWEDGRAS